MLVKIAPILLLVGAVIGQEQTLGDINQCRLSSNSTAAISQCVSDHPYGNIQSAADLESIFKSTTDCSQKASFSELLTCITNVQRNCITDNRYLALQLTSKQLDDTFTYLCQRPAGSYNYQCVIDNIQELGSCLATELNKFGISLILTAATFDQYKTFVCKGADAASICSTSILTSCPETATSLVELGKIQKPAACGGSGISNTTGSGNSNTTGSGTSNTTGSGNSNTTGSGNSNPNECAVDDPAKCGAWGQTSTFFMMLSCILFTFSG